MIKKHEVDYAAYAMQESREGFMRRFPYPFLLLHVGHKVDEQGHIDGDKDVDEWRFHTRTSMTAPKAKLGELKLQLGQDGYQIFPLVKEKDNPWQERISIGRASNNDIVLQDNSISKLHAHVQQNGQGQWLLTDVGSRNGSRVKNTKLTAKQPVVLDNDDVVIFGGLLFTFVDASKLYDLFRLHAHQQTLG